MHMAATSGQLAVVELLVDRILDEFVVSAVLHLEAEGIFPVPRLLHLAVGNDLNGKAQSAVAGVAQNCTTLVTAIRMDAAGRMLLPL